MSLFFSVYYFPAKRWFWSPPLPPPRFAWFPCPVQFARIFSLFFSYCLLSVCVCSFSRTPPAAFGHSAFVRRKSTTLRLTSDQCPLLVSCPASCMKVSPPPTCAAGCTCLGCGWRVEGDGAPHDGLEFLNASTGVAQLAFLCQRSWNLVNSRGTRLSVCPPPPLSPYNRRCPNTLPPNGRVFSWSLRAPSPR